MDRKFAGQVFGTWRIHVYLTQHLENYNPKMNKPSSLPPENFLNIIIHLLKGKMFYYSFSRPFILFSAVQRTATYFRFYIR